jgi:ABC-type Fe3+-hydroxamate transport system, periplasmic component
MIIHSQNNLGSKNYCRIVSLVPSQTELLYDLGLRAEVIGITKFCVHPSAWYKTKFRVGGTKTVKIHLVNEIKPDLIIANKEENVKEQIEN